ncbi:MAG: chemotaxis protein CheW [Spirochaetota bacterium]
MRNSQKNAKDSVSVADDTNQFVTFSIGNEFYGVEVLRVQEIIGMTQVTHVPNAVSFMKGVINLRGAVVPVIDLRIKFHMNEKEYDAFTVIIIVEVSGKLVGMIVDTVSDVANIPLSAIQDTPHFTAQISTDFIKGIGQLEDKLVIILDVEKILTADEMKIVERESVLQ